MFELLKELTELPGPIGHEGVVADDVARRWAAAGAEVSRTRVGNVVAELGGQGPRLMIQAHLDEMSLTVRAIDARGFVWLSNAARGSGLGILPEAVNREARIFTRDGHVDGVFARATGHHRLALHGDVDRGVSWTNVFVDLGLPSREAVLAAGVHVGSPVLYRSETRRLGELLAGKAFDDRVGLAIMTRFAERFDPASSAYRVTLVGTVQEETGVVGAGSLRADLGDFDAAIALEIGPAGDASDSPADANVIALGAGPCLVHEDSAVHYSVPLLRRLEDVARAEEVPFQHAIMASAGTDGVALLSQGIPTAVISVPTRYTHSAFEMVLEADVCHALALVEAFARA